MKSNHLFSAIIVLLFLSSCASTTQFVKFTGNSTPNPTPKARIYILRTASFKGGAVKMPIYCNGEIIGKIGSHSYLCWDVEEGKYNITSSTEGIERILGQDATENKDFFVLNAKAGKTYYIRQSPKFGFDNTAHVALTILSQSEGIRALKGLKNPKLNYAE